MCLELPARLPECVVLEGDILWSPKFADPEDDHRRFWDTWLRLAKNVHQAGRSVAWCGSAVPENFATSSERRYVGEIHYLALVCDDSVLVERLKAQTSWRQSSKPEFVEKMVQFNRWLRENADKTDPPLTLMDVTDVSVEKTAAAVAAWVRRGLG